MIRTLLLAGLLAGALGCSRAHLHKNHGKAFRKVLASQRADRPVRRGEGLIVGLDSEEADRIHNRYLGTFGSPSSKPDAGAKKKAGGGDLSDAILKAATGGGGY